MAITSLFALWWNLAYLSSQVHESLNHYYILGIFYRKIKQVDTFLQSENPKSSLYIIY